MKNKETTARHYNLLPNQGHAVRIEMKLYKKFTGLESVQFYVDSSTVNSFSRNLRNVFLLLCV